VGFDEGISRSEIWGLYREGVEDFCFGIWVWLGRRGIKSEVGVWMLRSRDFGDLFMWKD
jgi:hypothetical protein